MTRENKFRVWNKKFKMYGVGEMLLDQSGYLFSRIVGNSLYSAESEDNIVEQYTGLKDKNDKEIYEGDIIDFFGEKYLVTYRAGGFWAEYNKTQRDHLFLYSIESEIIGNVHENPELLEGEK